MVTLEQIIIGRGDIERLYKTRIPLTLWRALLNDSDTQLKNPLYPDFAPRALPNGDIRDPDVSVFIDPLTGVEKVRSEVGRGTSLTDKPGIFGNARWQYIVIPEGTMIPSALVITKDHYVRKKKSWHYSISPNYEMPKEEFLKALDQLARNAGIKLRSDKVARRG